jgi:hypothetical protein
LWCGTHQNKGRDTDERLLKAVRHSSNRFALIIVIMTERPFLETSSGLQVPPGVNPNPGILAKNYATYTGHFGQLSRYLAPYIEKRMAFFETSASSFFKHHISG